MTISGPLDGVLKGVSRIMEKLNEEPELARYQVRRRQSMGFCGAGDSMHSISIHALDSSPPPTHTTRTSHQQNLTTSYSRSTGPAHPMHPAFDIPTYHTQSFAETQQLFSPGVRACVRACTG